jgi:hypothetical protein
MPTQLLTDNALMNFRLPSWRRNQDHRSYYTWLSCNPTHQRVHDEFYALRIEINEADITHKRPEEILELVRFKIETALTLMESYRRDPPPLKNPFTQEETEDAHD